jgi:ABC-type nitrate/sulfonate/bicarbonate transport system substrate-binding protein
MTKTLRIGYVPLTDAALLHVAKAENFAAARGLNLELVRETSWANIRDKLVLGHFDAAHILAPAAIAASLGLGQLAAPLVAPVALNLNGNAITVSNALLEALRAEIEGSLSDPRATAVALSRLVAKRRERGEPALTFGHVFPFSTHHYQLRLWLRAGGIDPEEDIRLIVVPPPFMVETLRKGHVDGFCVGAPWNSLAAASGAGTILHSGPDIVCNCPEKVLAFRADWARSHEEEVSGLTQAIADASAWAADKANRKKLAALLADVTEPGVSPETIAEIMEAPSAEASTERTTSKGLRIDPDAIIPRRSHALWLFAQMVAARQVPYPPQKAAAAAAVYETLPGAGSDTSGEAPLAFGGPAFDPDNVPAYLAALGYPIDPDRPSTNA